MQPYTFPTKQIYTVSQKKQDIKLSPKTSPSMNRLSKLFSLMDSVVNLQQTRVEIFHHAFNMSLHYRVKNECQKNGVNLKYVR